MTKILLERKGTYKKGISEKRAPASWGRAARRGSLEERNGEVAASAQSINYKNGHLRKKVGSAMCVHCIFSWLHLLFVASFVCRIFLCCIFLCCIFLGCIFLCCIFLCCIFIGWISLCCIFFRFLRLQRTYHPKHLMSSFLGS